MKHVILFLLVALLVASCGPTTLILSSDQGAISCAAPKAKKVTVKVDNKAYNVKATKEPAKSTVVATQPSNANASNKQATQTNRTTSTSTTTSKRAVTVDAGSHEVQVTDKKGNEIYNGNVTVGGSENKVINVK